MANHLLHRCILGVLSHTTRLLCTHRTEYLERADVVLLMEAGHLVRTGNAVGKTLALVRQKDRVSRAVLAAPATPPRGLSATLSSSCPHRVSIRKQEVRGRGVCDNAPELLEPSCLGTWRAVTWPPRRSSDLQEQSSAKEKNHKALMGYYPEQRGHLKSSEQSSRKP